MLIDRYVFREIAGPSLLGLLVWTAIFVVNRFFLLADQWVAGTLTPADLATTLALYLPSIIVLTIPMSVLLGILIGFSRLSADSEITALRTTGVSYYRLLAPTVVLAVIGWLATAADYLVAVPWSNSQVVELQKKAAMRADVNREIQPGAWTNLSDATGQEAAIFARGLDATDPSEPWLTDVDIITIDRVNDVAEHHSADRVRITRVLTSETRARMQFNFKGLRSLRWKPNDPTEAPTLSTASSGERTGPEREIPGARSFATPKRIEKGARQQSLQELLATLRDIQRIQAINAIRLTDPRRADLMMASVKTPILPGMLDRVWRTVMLEIHKKFSIPVACLVFAAAGMPLGIATRRGGRPAAFVISIGVIMLWWITYAWGDAWCVGGKLSPLAGAWLPDAVLGIVGLNLLIGQRRQQAVGLYRALRDGMLLGATIFLLLAALLLYERLVAPPTPGGRAAYSLWVPAVGLLLLCGHVVFVVFRDGIAARLAHLSEAFRRPRRAAPEPLGRPETETHELAIAPPAPALPRWRKALERVRNGAVFAVLALVVFVVLQVVQADTSPLLVLRDALLGWEGAAIGILLVLCGTLQYLGVRLLSTLDWWILSAYVRWFTLVMGSILVLYVVITYLDLAGPILANRIGAPVVANFYLDLTPRMLFETVPVGAMVAALVSFGMLSRFSELTALRCGGISVYRIVAPIVLVGIVLSAGAFVVHDYVLPVSNERAEDLRRVIQGGPPNATRRPAQGFLFGEDGRSVYQFQRVVAVEQSKGRQQAQIVGLTILQQDAQDRVHALYSAADATWDGSQWVLHAGWHADIAPDNQVAITRFQSLPLASMERPEYFAAVKSDPEQMTFAEYSRYIDEQAAAGYPVQGLRVGLQKKLAFPAASLVLVMVGLPFAFTTGRRGAIYGLGVSIIVAVIYYVALAAFTALGSAGYLPPMAAAWAPNALFALAGFYLLLHVRT